MNGDSGHRLRPRTDGNISQTDSPLSLRGNEEAGRGEESRYSYPGIVVWSSVCGPDRVVALTRVPSVGGASALIYIFCRIKPASALLLVLARDL